MSKTIEAYKMRRYRRLLSRMDAEDLDWITMHGTHIPLDPDGTAVGGPVKGRSFKGAKSSKRAKRAGGQSPASSSTSSASSATRKPVHGSDVTNSYRGESDIKSVLKAQGYDGLPRVVSREEFDKAVKASNFIAQRSYSASSQEILDEYTDQLYNGEWYVECTIGGAQYGQGMYCAADYTGTLSNGIKAEMEQYSNIGEGRFGGTEVRQRQFAQELYQDEMRKVPNPLGEDLRDALTDELGVTNGWTAWQTPEKRKQAHDYVESRPEEAERLRAEYTEARKRGMEKGMAVERMSLEEFEKAYPGEKSVSKTETLTLDPSAKVVKYNDILEDFKEYRKQYDYEKQKPIATDKVLTDMGVPASQQKKYKKMIDLYEHGTTKKQIEQYEQLNKELGYVSVADLEEKIRNEQKEATKHVPTDVGAYAALKGYDAINAEGHGESGSYTVILNRSKCIFLDDKGHTDSEDETNGKTIFRLNNNGYLDAIRNGKVIGWVKTQETV